jgi:hypothetical protein
MNGAQDKVEFVPILFDPFASSCGVDRIVVQLNAGANFYIGIFLAQPIDFIEIDSGVITVMISESNVAQPNAPCAIHPRLKQRLRVKLHSMALRMGVVIGEELIANS